MLGMPVMSAVAIKPKTPNHRIKAEAIGKPMVAVNKVIKRTYLVCPDCL